MQPDGWDFRDFQGALGRQWRLLGVTIAIVLSMAVGVLYLVPPRYIATAWLYVDTVATSPLSQEPRPNPASETAKIESVVDLLGSDRTLLAVVRSMATNKGHGEAAGERFEQDAVAKLHDQVKVQRRGQTYLISVRAVAETTENAAKLANLVAQTYVRQETQAKVDEVLEERAAIRERVDAAGVAVVRAQEAADAAEHPDFAVAQELSAAKTQYQALMTRLMSLEAEVYLQVPSSRVVAEATPPPRPSSPDSGLVLAIGAGISLVLGLLMVIAGERLTSGFVREEEAGRALQLPALLSVPFQKLRRGVDGDLPLSPADQLALSPLSEFSEAVRRVRASVDQARHRLGKGRQSSGTVVMVTSATAGEGKTTLALSLARSYAMAGHSCLLIDCDLRNPSVHRYLGLEPSAGLGEYLTQPHDARRLGAMLTADDYGGACVAIGGLGANQATDGLIDSLPFARLVAAAQQNFEIVILDTPPVGTVADGLYLAAFADVVTFVVRYRTAPRVAAVQAVGALVAARRREAELIGVLNLHSGLGVAKGYRASVYASV